MNLIPIEKEPRTRRPGVLRSERGAIVIHAAIAFLGLTAFSTFVADYGMLWTARRQAQNAADAAALAAASSLGYVDVDDAAAADAAAIAAAQRNLVWGQAPSITAGDVSIVGCPGDAPPNGICVRADVYRAQARGNALPMWFGALVGLTTQDVRATATAEVRFGRAAAEGIRPLAIPDMWQEMATPPWDLNDEFNLGSDIFVPGEGGTGFVALEQRPDGSPGDLGREIIIKYARGRSDLEPGMYAPVRLGASNGANDYRNNLEDGWNGTISPGDVLGVEPGGMAGPTAQAFETIIDRDPGATWVGGLGGRISGGCQAAGTCGLSPRVIPIIAFNPTIWAQDPNGGPGGGHHGGGCRHGQDCWNGPGSVTVTQVFGVFVERMLPNNEIRGRIVRLPTLGLVGTGDGGDANNVNITLVR